jgi:hypothetical protein
MHLYPMQVLELDQPLLGQAICQEDHSIDANSFEHLNIRIPYICGM